MTGRHLNYLGASSAAGYFTQGVLHSRFFTSLLGSAEPRFIDLRAMPQNLSVVLGFSQGGYEADGGITELSAGVLFQMLSC